MAWTLTVFVFLLFAFPNYCEKCSYRDVSRLLAEQRQEIVPACCAKKGAAGESPEKKGKPGGTHVRYTYCLSKSLSSIIVYRDVPREIREAVRPELFRFEERAFARLSPLLDHKDSRGPPA